MADPTKVPQNNTPINPPGVGNGGGSARGGRNYAEHVTSYFEFFMHGSIPKSRIKDEIKNGKDIVIPVRICGVRRQSVVVKRSICRCGFNIFVILYYTCAMNKRIKCWIRRCFDFKSIVLSESAVYVLCKFALLSHTRNMDMKRTKFVHVVRNNFI